MAVKTSWAAGDVLLAADLTDTFAAKYSTPATWTSYTPTFTNITIGNGSYNAYYVKVGKAVFVQFAFQLGSTSAIGSGPAISMPSSGFGARTQMPATYFDTSANASYLGRAILVVSTLYLQRDFVTGNLIYGSDNSATVPFTWASGDRIDVIGIYQET